MYVPDKQTPGISRVYPFSCFFFFLFLQILRTSFDKFDRAGNRVREQGDRTRRGAIFALRRNGIRHDFCSFPFNAKLPISYHNSIDFGRLEKNKIKRSIPDNVPRWFDTLAAFERAVLIIKMVFSRGWIERVTSWLYFYSSLNNFRHRTKIKISLRDSILKRLHLWQNSSAITVLKRFNRSSVSIRINTFVILKISQVENPSR